MNKRIVFIIPYFGSLPWYFSFFIHTCGYNPGVKFVLLTDCKIQLQLPSNVALVKTSFRDLVEVIGKKLGLDVVIPEPYKLCDFRPTFGVVFRELIAGYDFWGSIDIDIILGNLRYFLTGKVLDNHDIICARHDYVSGWFTLYRNTENINNLYTLSKDYQRIFTSGKYFNFDETNFKFFEFAHNLPYYLVKSEVESMTHLVKRLQECGYIKPYFDMHAIEGKPGNTIWKDGHLIYKSRFEVLLYHLLELKHIYKPANAPKIMPSQFRISATRIY
jgi:hypothetical protein